MQNKIKYNCLLSKHLFKSHLEIFIPQLAFGFDNRAGTTSYSEKLTEAYFLTPIFLGLSGDMNQLFGANQRWV